MFTAGFEIGTEHGAVENLLPKIGELQKQNIRNRI